MTVTVSVRLDEDVKEKLDDLVDELGMSLSAFFTVYAKQAVREGRIPFMLSARESVDVLPVSVSSLDDVRAVELLEQGIEAEREAELLSHEEATRSLREDGIIV